MAQCLPIAPPGRCFGHYDAVIDTPIPGVALGMHWRQGAVVGIDFLPDQCHRFVADDDALYGAVNQLKAYFADACSAPAIPIELRGSDFQRRVWQAIRSVPVGSVVTYAELAKHLDSSPRAIGGACGRNPVPVIVPCHRVVASTGIGGFSAALVDRQIDIKRWLLEHERHVCPG